MPPPYRDWKDLAEQWCDTRAVHCARCEVGPGEFVFCEDCRTEKNTPYEHGLSADEEALVAWCNAYEVTRDCLCGGVIVGLNAYACDACLDGLTVAHD